jgi:formylglycine-generating enzyme required for sulfatase activity
MRQSDIAYLELGWLPSDIRRIPWRGEREKAGTATQLDRALIFIKRKETMTGKMFLTCIVVALAGLTTFTRLASATVTFDWATVGNPGNAADPATGFGAVAYEYRISKYEVTNAQYAEFLNAVDSTGVNTLSLYNNSVLNGIENTGITDGARYVVQAGRENNPVSNVSSYDSIRFINWLHNGAAPGSDTETGAYMLLGGTATPSNSSSITRNSDAMYYLPSQDEWYKAAYHDASAGSAGNYFLYATSSDNVPVSDQPGDNPAAVNYFKEDGVANGFNDGYAVWSSTFTDNPFTDVGAYTDADSPYGTFDQNGNIIEWNEVFIGGVIGTTSVLRGGSWTSDGENNLASSGRINTFANFERDFTGFRIASPVPEPGTVAVFVMGAGVMLRRRCR